MQFLISHWHCIIPVAAILVGWLIMNRRDKEDSAGKAGSSEPVESERLVQSAGRN
jgi:hypothetical protein